MSWLRGLVVAWLVVASAPPASAQSTPAADDAIPRLLNALEQVLTTGQPPGYLHLISSRADREAALAFARDNMPRPVDRVTVRERARSPLGSAPSADAWQLTVEILFESGNRGRLATWQLDVRRQPALAEASLHRDVAAPAGWEIENQRQLTTFENLYRLSLDPAQEFAAHDLLISAEDVQIKLSDGVVFVATTEKGPTGLVLLGKGEMDFAPAAASERGQVALFSGSPALHAAFDACYVRLNPARLADHVGQGRVARAVDAGDLRKAQAVFAEDAPQSFSLDLGDLSASPWSMLPSEDDFLADVHTRRDGTLTYSRSTHEQEDIALFDRQHRRYVALYPSKAKLASRGRFYGDDDHADYDVTHYDIDATFAPDRGWIEGRTRLDLRVRASSLTSFEVRLADPLAVRSVVAAPFGRLLGVRVRGQNALVVTLPATLTRDARLSVTIAYAGQLPAQQGESENAQGPPGLAAGRQPAVARSYLYSSQVAWYAQAPVRGYATATLHITVPEPYSCAASGKLIGQSSVAATAPNAPAARQFVFDAPAPIRYAACLITALVGVGQPAIAPPANAGACTRMNVEANPGEQPAARQAATQADDIVRFYASVMHDCPYPDLTLAVVEHQLPGGESPAYLSILDEQVATSRLLWRDDPASFAAFPEFFAAHEIAHQWWGGAVGGKNYHEEWLSEAFAQYFAALYAEHAHGPAVLAGIIRQMQHWTERDSGAGPVYLGQRIGQLRNDARAYRAVVYDKGALALHMLRRMIGDEAFFDGLRLFYQTWKFRKAGSDDLRAAFEKTSGASLDRFFDRWIYGDTLPRVKYAWRVDHDGEGDVLDLRFEQAGDVFDFPVTVTIEYAGRPTANIVIPVTDRVVERRVPLAGRVKSVQINADEVVPADISRQ